MNFVDVERRLTIVSGTVWIQHLIPVVAADVRSFQLIVLPWKTIHISEVSGRVEIAVDVSTEFFRGRWSRCDVELRSRW
jgi:hypothetical protein